MVTIEPAERDAVAAFVAHIVGRLARTPRMALGLATGATMVPVYAGLVAAHRAGKVSFRGVTSFNLDEYVGIAPGHPSSYRATMDALLFSQVDIDRARSFVPLGNAPDLAAEAARYEQAIRDAGGIDLQLLGIGRNGHIGFNEPGSSFASRTRIVDLHPATRAANAGFFPDAEVPRQAITMGIATILSARALAVLATGAGKRDAVRAALHGPATPACPASALQSHPDAGWWLDAAAGAG